MPSHLGNISLAHFCFYFTKTILKIAFRRGAVTSNWTVSQCNRHNCRNSCLNCRPSWPLWRAQRSVQTQAAASSIASNGKWTPWTPLALASKESSSKSMNPLNVTQPSHGKRAQSNTNSKPALKVPCLQPAKWTTAENDSNQIAILDYANTTLKLGCL